MNWNDLRIFLTAVRAGSYTAAGPQLGMDRTTVGRRVAALEADLHTALFRDTPAGPEPTEAGRILLGAAARIEAELRTAVEMIEGSPPDPAPLRIASSAGIAALLLDDLRGQTAPSLELVAALDPIEAVTHRRADLAVAMIRAAPRRLAGRHVGQVAQACYARRGSSPQPPLGWGAEAILALPRHWAEPNDRGDAAPAVRLNHWPTMLQAVRDGLGSAWLPCFLGDADPQLARIAGPDPRAETGLWLLHRADTPQSATAIALIDRLAERIGARLGAA